MYEACDRRSTNRKALITNCGSIISWTFLANDTVGPALIDGSLKNSSSMKMSLQEIHDLRTLLEKIS